MPFKGFCLTCNDEIRADTKAEFGEALIVHHQSWMKRSRGSIVDRCNVFQAMEVNNDGSTVVQSFGLDITMEVVSRAWSGELWYERKSGKEKK